MSLAPIDVDIFTQRGDRVGVFLSLFGIRCSPHSPYASLQP